MSFPCVFSPLSTHLMQKEPYRILALQFFIKDLLAAHQALLEEPPSQKIVSTPPPHFPYSWARPAGYLNKTQEHIRLLCIAFPSFSNDLREIEQLLEKLILQSLHMTSKQRALAKKKIYRIVTLATPLIRHLRFNENLVLFLLQHQEAIKTLMGTHYLHDLLGVCKQQELQTLEATLCQNYKDRGFPFLVPQLKTLMSDLHQK